MEIFIITGNKSDRQKFKRKLDEYRVKYLLLNLLEPYNNFLDMFVEKDCPDIFYPLREEIIDGIKNRGLNFIRPIELILENLRDGELAILESVDEKSRIALQDRYGAFSIKLVSNDDTTKLPYDYYLNVNNIDCEFEKLNKVFKFKIYEYEGVEI